MTWLFSCFACVEFTDDTRYTWNRNWEYLEVKNYLFISHISIKPSSTPSNTTYILNKFIKRLHVSAKVGYMYRVSHELRSLLRESVPYVKIYRYNPKHLCPKLNGYGDNGKRKVWTSWGCTHYTCQLAVIYVRPCVGCHVTECTVSHVSQASHVTSAFGIPVSCIVLRTLRITITRVRMFLYFNSMALCHSQVTLMLSTDINITETTYSCQFQYEFGNQ